MSFKLGVGRNTETRRKVARYVVRMLRVSERIRGAEREREKENSE